MTNNKITYNVLFFPDKEKTDSIQENTFIEENGFNLSGGERQRIILARGLLKAKNYIFIDEALSEVDFELEKTIVKNSWFQIWEINLEDINSFEEKEWKLRFLYLWLQKILYKFCNKK